MVTQKKPYPEEESTEVAFSRIFEDLYPRVLFYIYSRVSDKEVAKDLTAETFARAYRSWEDLRCQEARVAWVFRIAANLVVGYVRRRRRESQALNDLGQMQLALEGGEEHPERFLIREEQLRRLRVALQYLTPRERRVLSLRFDAGLSGPQVAEIMGLSEINVRIITFRALKKLRNLMKSEAA